MIDPDKAAKMDRVMGYEEYSMGSLARMTESELRALRSEIDALLPKNTLDGLNLEVELVEQFHTVKGLQSEVLNDSEVPANQRAQVASAVAATLQKLIDLQVDMQRDERLKRIERTLLEAIADLPESAKTKFFADYEQLAQKSGAAQ